MASGDSSDTDLVPVSARAPQPEQRLFGRFTLKRVLGRGGMGIVWLAADEELQRNVAMKFLPDMLIRDPDAVKDLKRETRRSLDLTHHHIVRIYDFIQDDSSAAIVMEYVDGESLSAMKSKQPGGCFGPTEISHWVAHFCMAMDYAHNQARVVHRDLKPANLMVNSRSKLKVTDFGISRSLSDSMTRVSLANNAGTLAYMSPEQALGSPPAPADDIYAFGATLYDLLTGRPPFFRGNLQIQLETVMPPPLMQRRRELDNDAEDIPPLWEEVIMACLSKRPEDRPKTLGEVGHLLGILGPTGPRSMPIPGGTDTARTTLGTSSINLSGDAMPTVRELDSPRSSASRAQLNASPTTLEDILSHGVERTTPANPAVDSERPPTQAPSAKSVVLPSTPVVPPPVAGTPSSAQRTAPGSTIPTGAHPPSTPPAEPPSFPAEPASSAGRVEAVPVTSPSRRGLPWHWIGIAAVVVIAGVAALAWPKKPEAKVVSADPASSGSAATAVPDPPAQPPATPAPVAVTEPPAPDPIAMEAERLVQAAERALATSDLVLAKREIIALREKDSDNPALAALSQKLDAAEKQFAAMERQKEFDSLADTAEKAIADRDISGARTAIGKAAAIDDNARVAELRTALARLETPPATPVPVAVTPPAPATPAPRPAVDRTENDPPKRGVAATKPRSEPRVRDDPPPRRATPRPQAQTPPEPRPQPRPQTPPPSRQDPPKRKVFSIPGS